MRRLRDDFGISILDFGSSNPDRYCGVRPNGSERRCSSLGIGPGVSKIQNPKSEIRNPRSLRRGVSLVELLIVISIATVVVGMCVTTIHLLLRTQRDESRGVRTTVTLSRLAETFRDDVHATSQSEIGDDETGRRLLLEDEAGRRIVYRADEHQLRRIETLRGAEVHRDTFYFPLESKIDFAREEPLRLVRISIDVGTERSDAPPPERVRPPSRAVRIEAIADRDRRLAGGTP